MKESLEKLIRRVILKKYPWIKNFDISVSKDREDDLNLYYVRYYVDDDIYDDLYVGDKKKIKTIKSETINLFDVLGPSEYDMLDGVFFSIYED
jgi:hypothetical protein